MRTILCSSLLFLSLFCIPELTYCQWQALTGPEGATVNGFATLGNKVFAASYEGIFISTDEGVTWNPAPGVSSHAVISYITTVGNNVVAAYDSILYRSMDAGLTWQVIMPTGVPSGTRFTTLFSTGTSLLTMVMTSYYSNSYYRSTDAGATWNKLDSASVPPNWNSNVLRIGSRLFATGDVYGGSQIYQSMDDGATWQQAQNALPAYGPVAIDGDTMILGSTAIYRSLDGGATWTNIGNELGIYGEVNLVSADGAFYATVLDEGVYRSTDGGETWEMFDKGLPDLFGDVIVSAGNSVLLADMRESVFRLPPQGTRWVYSTFGLPRQTFYCLDTTSNGAMLGASSFFADISWDEGWDWQPFREAVGFVKVFRDTIHMPGEDYISSSISGTSSQMLQVPIDSLVFDTNASWGGSFTNTAFGRDGTRGFCIADSELVIVEDGLPLVAGIVRDSGLPPDSEAAAIGWNGTSLFAATRAHGMYRSSDTGATWSKSSSGIPDDAFATMSDLPLDYFNGPLGAIASDGATIYVGTPIGIYRSTDNGTTWANTSVGLPSGRVWSVASYSFGVFAGVEGNGIYFSYDHGVHWSSHTWNIPSGATFYAFQPFNGYLYAAGDSGIFRAPIPLAAGVTPATGEAASLSLGAVYPNPVRSSGEVSFEVAQSGTVDLSLYDLLGRKVQELTSGYYSPGTHFATLDAMRFAAGSYIAVLRSSEHQVSKIIQVEP